MPEYRITACDVKNARKAFETNEPRDLFYRAATELVDLALRHSTSLTVAEALAVLLQTWNKAYYQFRKFDNSHFASIEDLLVKHESTLTVCRTRDINDFGPRDKPMVTNLFQAFENVLGPVGAAKALHLLAPGLFPIWDRTIAESYDLKLGVRGSNAQRYWRFILIAQKQCSDLKREHPYCQNPLKSIDEYNYCRYTKRWIS